MATFDIHHHKDLFADTSVPDPHQDTYSKTVLGFWMYLMTDCILFCTLFVTYAVLRDSTFGGPASRDIYQLDTAFIETLILLFSTVACGFAMLAAKNVKKFQVLGWLAICFVLGASFVALEIHEFSNLVQKGESWTKSAFLSSYFTLVGTHGLHVSIGLLWMFVMIVQVLRMGVTVDTFRRLSIFSMFWHFLDLIWIFIFTFVYLMGVL